MTIQQSPKEFTIIKFQQGCILLQHRLSKKIYQYIEPKNDLKQSNITHSLLIKPIIYNNGLLFIKGKSTLQNELTMRKRAYEVIHYEEDELKNTFLPILQCITHIHNKQSIHGFIHPLNIIITQNDQIKLKDSLSQIRENTYYFNKKKSQIMKQDDITAWGHIMIQFATLRKGNKMYTIHQTQNLVESLVQKYTKGFIFALIVILRKNKQKYINIKNYIQNQKKYLQDPQLNFIYDLVKKNKDKKKTAMIANENIIPNTPKTNIGNLSAYGQLAKKTLRQPLFQASSPTKRLKTFSKKK